MHLSPRHGFFRNREAEQAIRKELKLLLVLDNPFIIKLLCCKWVGQISNKESNYTETLAALAALAAISVDVSPGLSHRLSKLESI